MRRIAALVVILGFVGLPASAAVLLTEGFEPPAMSLGPIHNQNGWTGNTGTNNLVTNAQVHSGVQAATTSWVAQKNLPAPLQVHAEPAWFIEAWGYIGPLPGGPSFSGSLYAGSALGTAFFVDLRDDGQLTMNTGTNQTVRNLGSVALHKWLRFRIEKIAPLTLLLSLTGDGVSETYVAAFGVPWDPQFVGVSGGTNSGGPFWDDVIVATDAPTPVLMPSWGRLKALYRK